jgi:hypothetical protein
MGIETIVKSVAAPLIGGLFGKSGGSKQVAPQTVSDSSTQTTKLDPAIQKMIFGDGTSAGLLGKYQGYLDQQQPAGLALSGKRADDFIGANGAIINDSIMSGSNRLMQGNQAPQMAAQNGVPFSSSRGASYNPAAMAQFDPSGFNVANASAAYINAPKQNGIDTSGAYNNFINGNAAENPYLTGAIQKGLNQSAAAFQNSADDARSALAEGLQGVRGGAIASGQYGGSRQAIAESKVADSITKQLSRALSQVGQNQTDAAIAAQAGAFDAGQNRSLNALSGLSGNQYGIAGQQASLQQQANMQNAGAANNFASQNSQMGQQLALANANAINQNNQYYSGLGQNNNQFNAQGQNQMGQYNAGLQQQTNQNNLQAQLSNNAQNANMLQGGLSGLSSLYGNNYNQANASSNYDINRAQQVNGLLSPYLNANATTTRSGTQSTPQYENSTANFLGGAALGQKVLGGIDFGSFFGGSKSTPGNNYSGTPTFNYATAPNTFSLTGN